MGMVRVSGRRSGASGRPAPDRAAEARDSRAAGESSMEEFRTRSNSTDPVTWLTAVLETSSFAPHFSRIRDRFLTNYCRFRF